MTGPIYFPRRLEFITVVVPLVVMIITKNAKLKLIHSRIASSLMISFKVNSVAIYLRQHFYSIYKRITLLVVKMP